MDFKHFRLMEIDKELKEKIINCGVFGYDEKKMANILDIDAAEIKKMLSNKKSEFYLLYEKGKDRADYVIDLKLFEMAKAGDLKALEKLEYRKINR